MKRTLRTAALAGASLVLAGGAAMAASASLHKMNVSLPDGSVAQIEYAGDVAPRVVLQPVAQDAASGDPFAEFDRISAMMEQQQQAMLQRVAAMQADAMKGAGGQPGMVTVSTNLPKGTYHYEFVSTTSGNGTCAQTVSWSSDGASAEPRMTKTSSGDCDAAKSGKPSAVPVSAPAGEQAPAASNKV